MTDTVAAPFTRLADVYDAIMVDVPYDDWVAFLLREATARGFAGGRLLDVACGTGNATVPVRQRGFGVDGVDGSDAMLAVARRKLPEVRFVHGDLRRFATGRRYALAYAIFDALNNLLADDDFVRAARRVRRHLLPGGLFAFDCNTRQGLRELWEHGTAEGDHDTVRYRWVHHYDPERELATVEATCSDAAGTFTEVHHERPYDPDDLVRLLRRAGFGAVDVIVHPDGQVARAHDPRVWAFARA
ncbi:MAG: methyltransferase domain-containing protein [Trueperaceae bacterium]